MKHCITFDMLGNKETDNNSNIAQTM